MIRQCYFFLFSFLTGTTWGQILVARDTITVIENNYVLKMPWANGINFANASNIDLNGDNKKDIVLFDRLNQYGVGRFRCFVNAGNTGQIKYKADTYNSYFFPEVSNWAVLRDYNCDGKEDIFCSTNAGIKVYKNITTIPGDLRFTLFKSLLYSNFQPQGPPSVGNLYASTIGVPGIVDIDGDGDLDILTFSPEGYLIEYHKNISTVCDSLIYERSTDCWGGIAENNCTVSFQQCGLAGAKSVHDAPEVKTYHAGSCLTCIDSDNDGDQDLIMGDISCNTLQYVHNTGTSNTADFTDTTKLYPNFPNKGNTTQINLTRFPCAYSLDADGDNKNDLIATPNSVGSENTKSVWLYRNTSATSTVNFQFVKNNFLQDEMIEVGQNSFPILFDYNGDNKKDLLIGNYGYYNGNTLSARLTLYKNTGNIAQPTLSLITRDYASLSTKTLSNGQAVNNCMSTAGDIDNDGDVDLLIGTSSGQVHWLENTAGAGNVCNFSIFKENPFLFTTASGIAAPQLFDLDNDGKLDLLIGTKNGRVSWYKNTGSASVPSFSLITNFLGNIDVKGNPNYYGFDGYAAPYFFREAGITKALVGSVSGSIFYYSVPSNLLSPFILVSSGINGYNEGGQSTVCFEDINNDAKPDLFIGNAGGGLTFCSSKSPLVGLAEFNPEKVAPPVSLYPSPANTSFTCRIGNGESVEGLLKIVDPMGKVVLNSPLSNREQIVDVSHLSKGLYFISIAFTSDFQNYRVTKKLIIE